MQAHIMSLHTPLSPEVGSKDYTVLSESSHVAHRIKGNEI